MLRQTLWRPDVCECVFIYEWDDELPEDTRRHILVKVVQRGPERAHQTPSEEDLYKIILEECRFKEQTRTIIQQLNPTLNLDLWHYDAERKLHVVVLTLTPQQREFLQAMCDTAFGVGKVVVA